MRKKISNPKQKAKNKSGNGIYYYIVWLGAGVLDYMSGVGIYLGNLLGQLLPALLTTLKLVSQYAFFPISASMAVTYAICAWFFALTDKNKKSGKFKKEHLIRASINTFSTFLVVPAVIVGIALGVAGSIITSAFYGVNLAITGIYNFIALGVHSFLIHKKQKLKKKTQDPERREELTEEIKGHRASRLSHFVVGITTILIATAGAIVLFGGFIPGSVLGIIASTIGAAFFAYATAVTLMNHRRKQKAAKATMRAQENPEMMSAKTEVELANTQEHSKDQLQKLDTTPRCMQKLAEKATKTKKVRVRLSDEKLDYCAKPANDIKPLRRTVNLHQEPARHTRRSVADTPTRSHVSLSSSRSA